MSDKKYMLDEKNILININETVYKFLLLLYETKNSISEIKSDVLDLDNNFFLEDKDNIYKKLTILFEEEAINDLISELIKFNNIVIQKVDNCCNHIWIEDLIDLTPDKCKTINYCKICQISKKD